MTMDSKKRTFVSDIKTLEDKTIEFIAVTEKYVPKEIIPNLAKWGTNQPIIYRHEHPAKGYGGQILGRSTKATVEQIDGLTVLKGKAILFDKTDMHKMALEYIQRKEEAKEPIQISIGYEEFYDEEGKIVDAQIYEYSLTHIPVCKECVVSIGSELEMTEPEKVKELEDKLKEGEATISELQTALDTMSGKTTQLESDNTALKSKVKEYEDKYVAQKDEVSKLTTRITELENGIKYAKVEPKVQELVKLYEDPALLDYVKGKWMSDGEAWLDKKLEERKKIVKSAPIATQTMKEMEAEVKPTGTPAKLSVDQAKTVIKESVKDESVARIITKMLKK